MTDAVATPATPAATTSAATGEQLDTLRRFHLGDPRVEAPQVPLGLLPAALHPLRDRPVRGGWPLLVLPSAAGEEAFAVPVGERLGSLVASGGRLLVDNAARLERALRAVTDGGIVPAAEALRTALATVAAELDLPATERGQLADAEATLVAGLPADAVLVAFGRHAPLLLAHLAAERQLRAARTRVAATVHELATGVGALLDADRERRPAATPTRERAGRLGAMGSLLDADRLASVVAHRRAGAAMPVARRERLEAVRRTLGNFELAAGAPRWIAVEELEVPAALGRVRRVEDPFAAADHELDEALAGVFELVRAIRVARLELAEAFDLERHLPWLDRLDLASLDRDELALVPPVLVVVEEGWLTAARLPMLSRLLRGNRPLQLIVLQGVDGDGRAVVDPAAARLELGYLGIGHREAFVAQASVARPQGLAASFVRALASVRPALHLVDVPVFAPDDLDPWLVASARVSGRVAPLLRYDPSAGTTWARRLRFDDNPEPAADWPREALPADVAGLPGDAAFTFADAMLLDPAWRAHVALAAGANDDLVPLADWLELATEEAVRKLPFVWAVDREGVAQRVVVDRTLVAACRDRLAFWRTLEELAGVRNEHVEEAVARARREEREAAAREREELSARHRGELEQLRAAADVAAVERVVTALFAVEATGPLAVGPPAIAPVTMAPLPTSPAPVAAGATAPAATVTSAPAVPASEPVAAAAASDEPSEAWVDTPLCTSCDECIRKSPGIFAYNADKQAYVKDPRGGTFRELVLAAEACTAKIIHVGTPWNPNEPDLATWQARGAQFR